VLPNLIQQAKRVLFFTILQSSSDKFFIRLPKKKSPKTYNSVCIPVGLLGWSHTLLP